MTTNFVTRGAALLFAASLLAPNAFAADSCGESKQEQIGSAKATASLWANARGSKGSIKAESDKLVAASVSKVKEAKKDGVIVLKTIPAKYKSDYSDKELCSKYLAQTQEKPFEYKGRNFASLDKLNEWLGDFTQGKGKDGKDLYKKCDGSCSPQYTTKIKLTGNTYTVDSSVVCGHARDKDDNMYDLTATVQWQCG